MKIYNNDWWSAANRLYYILHPKHRKNLKSYKNKHLNERCFIIGNGPSLTIKDLELLKNEKTMVCNSIIKIFGDLSFKPTYYFAQDAQVIKDNLEIIKSTEEITKFIRSYYSGRYHVKDAIYYNVYEDQIAFSPDISVGVYCGWTVVYSMIQFAVYMGFSEIYLLGVDFNYAKNNTEINADCYFDKRMFNPGINYALPKTDVTTAAFQQARNYSESNGTKIYNATRGGKLEIFERKNFDESGLS